MSTVEMTAPRAAATTRRVRAPKTTTRPAGGGASPVRPGRRRNRLATAVRNVGIALGTTARVVFLGRDGVGL
ncbi:hypothetical protein [Kitasatospora sp. NPDC050543]|uniref:hypothetical protein n=1 Tax=Kitasatospora sp. NPDC050543 TaxID=3364054 RepID=UPI0037AE490F